MAHTEKIFKAISKRDIKSLRRFIKEGGDVNAVDPSSYFRDTALIRAVDVNYAEAVQELIQAGVLVDKTNAVGDTALIDAARYGCAEIVKDLIASEASMDKKNKEGITALMSAAKCGCTEAVKALLSSGASLTVKNKRGETAVVVARQSPHSKEEIVRILEAAEDVIAQKTQLKENNTDNIIQMRKNGSAASKFNSLHEYPLVTNPSHPDVTFLGEAQVTNLTSYNPYHDFQNGIEMRIPSCPDQELNSRFSVQQSFAPGSVFSLPRGIESASASFLISSSKDELDHELSLSMEHSVNIQDEKDAHNLLLLQASTTPKISNSKVVYEFEEVPGVKSEFKPKENKGRFSLTRRISEKFFRIGFRKKRSSSDPQPVATSNGAAAQANSTNLSSNTGNLYTLRVYRSPAQSVLDRRIAIITVSLFGKSYSRFWSVRDVLHKYPELSSQPVDWTEMEPLTFTEASSILKISEIAGWIVNTDVKQIIKRAVDFPLSGQFSPDDLCSYPPRIICTFHTDKNSPVKPADSCTLSMTGFDVDVSVNMPLVLPYQVQQYMPDEVLQLRKALENLKASARSIQFTNLGSTITNVMTLMEKILSSSSLEEVVCHTEMFTEKISALSALTQAAASACSNSTIEADIEACLTNLNSLSHQFCQFAKVKLRYCQGSLQGSALAELVDSGARVLRSVNFLFQSLHTLHATVLHNNKAYDVLVGLGEKITSALSQEPKDLAVLLFEKGIISERVLEETNQLNEINQDKSRRLYISILEKTKATPKVLYDLMSILRKKGDVYADLLRILEYVLKIS